jgi:hypothetical protein
MVILTIGPVPRPISLVFLRPFFWFSLRPTSRRLDRELAGGALHNDPVVVLTIPASLSRFFLAGHSKGGFV